MLAVLAVCVLGPFSTAYVLGPAALLLLPVVGGMLGVTLGLGVLPGSFRLPDEITAGITGGLVALYFVLLLWMTCWTKVEAFFEATPWLRHCGKMQATAGGRKYATRCPFTGYKPNMRCPSCDARVHDSAFHKTDRLVAFPVGETVLRWDGAKEATEMTDGVRDITKARQQLDRFLDLRGNTLFASTTACCVGCATWQRNFNLVPRLTLSLALAALFFAFVPWGFASFLNGDGSSGSTIGGAGAKAVVVICEVLAVQYAAAGLLVQLQALLRANDFLHRYRALIPSLKPVLSPSSRLVALLNRGMLRAPWQQAV
ncbi:anaerobic ribonucleoside triphosphate reductase [Chlorella sorokiniana]|uniref:Anaerobic ribonucleoside triphosphate reductase n=1 Tax=Chlorella sorokiniana TaxID=3076 RepID=A0A2P6U0G0_CHLSO|nr:anaerobic ribonucleoside triphosphate reductase [Chlorella sorokiniana]|eukprot:PRW59788.1 anaerobic ribonucleoside triphosphate reductase [Chlorella sorokiniana]